MNILIFFHLKNIQEIKCLYLKHVLNGNQHGH